MNGFSESCTEERLYLSILFSDFSAQFRLSTRFRESDERLKLPGGNRCSVHTFVFASKSKIKIL